jgi:hypothetical protein
MFPLPRAEVANEAQSTGSNEVPASQGVPSSQEVPASQQLTDIMAQRPKRHFEELKIHEFGVLGLRVSDFEPVDSDGAASSDDGQCNDTYYCIGGSFSPSSCLTRELNQLSMAGREQVGQDLYGISECTPIDGGLLATLEEEIHRIEQKPAYDLALKLSPSYVRNEGFRTMFLRATEGDCRRAAKRLVRHFATKLRLFGESRLGRGIKITDLDEHEMESLESGGFQVLADRDRAGRSVLFGRYTSMRYREIDNMLRALWYIWMSILEDPLNQTKGVVAVGYEVGKVPLQRFDGLEGSDHAPFEMHNADGGFDKDLARQIVSIPLSVPARPVGYHLCTDSHHWVGILNMIMATLCKFIRLRMRIHHGSDQECRYALMSHGLPTRCIPVDESGVPCLKRHMEWLASRRLIDAMKP